jgi:hypothetical protein
MRAMASSPLHWGAVALIVVAILLFGCGGSGGGPRADGGAPPADAPAGDDVPGGVAGMGGGPTGGASGAGGAGGAGRDAPVPVDTRALDTHPADAHTAPPDGRAHDAGQDRPAPDARPGRDAPAGRDTARDMIPPPPPPPDARPTTDQADPTTCSPGSACLRGESCQRACLGGRVDNCRCSDGRFYCTGCMAVDGGGSDARDFPNCTGNVSVDGKRCEAAGNVCDYPGPDGSKRLCVCGSAAPDLIWICQ